MSFEATAENRIIPAPDRDEILRVVSLYLDGWGAHHPEMFAEAFHPASHIYFTSPDGTLTEFPLYTQATAPEGGWADQKGHSAGRIFDVVQAGDVAAVLLAWDGNEDRNKAPVKSYVDIHTLLRLDGTWKIMSKTATHFTRADWAGANDEAPTTPDCDEILRVLRLYTDGFSNHPEMFAEAFHPAAHGYWTGPDGELWEGPVIPFLVGHSGGGGHVEGRVLQVIQAGDVAVVLLGFDGYDKNGVPDSPWVDFHTLLRLNGSWKIMAKTATHASRADWAGPGASS